MGGGSWTDSDFRSYSHTKGRVVGSSGALTKSYSNQEMFKSSNLDDALNPKNVIRECCDSEEHPNVIPVILALDVTGSMGQTAVEIAKKLNIIMTNLYNKLKDVQFLIMGIGDVYCDKSPAQASQFESDIRIADQLEKIYFEFGGGSNPYESYTLPWYFALNHTKIDAIDKRGKKGIIITIGDEQINPYLPKKGTYSSFSSMFGDNIQCDIDTKSLYNEVKQKFECFHIHVKHDGLVFEAYTKNCINSFVDIMGEDRVFSTDIDNIANVIVDIISNNANKSVNDIDNVINFNTESNNISTKNENGEIVW